MGKKILTCFIMLVIMHGAFAQKINNKKFHASAGLQIGFAIDDFSVTNPIGVGVSVQAEALVSKLIAVTISGGYIYYKDKDASNPLGYIIKYKPISITPIELGIRYYLSDNFYAAAQAGIAFFNTAFVTNKKSGFVYSPAIGFNSPLKNGHAIDISAIFSGYTKKGIGISSLGVRLAYRI